MWTYLIVFLVGAALGATCFYFVGNVAVKQVERERDAAKAEGDDLKVKIHSLATLGEAEFAAWKARYAAVKKAL